jgi:uncharacterized protein
MNIQKFMSDFILYNTTVKGGERKRVEIPVASLFDYTKISIPIEIVNGGKGGPTLFVSAAIHGDEIIGVEIVRRLLARKELADLKGVLVAIPVVNPFGYNSNTRYLPDRRDLNRCFPGSEKGSLAARIANTFIQEVVSKCDYGIDIHSGAIHRFNFPQVRLLINDQAELNMAKAFGAPVIINSPLRSGTLRKTCQDLGIKSILYEAGEALRFDDHAINTGVHGILRVMQEVGVLEVDEPDPLPTNVMIAKSSYWLRAPESGSLRIKKSFGSFVQTNDILGTISDPYGDRKVEVRVQNPGVIIGAITMPLVNRGNALFHIATLDDMQFVSDDESTSIVLDQDIDIENEDWFSKR